MACVWGFVGHSFGSTEPLHDAQGFPDFRENNWIQAARVTDATPFELYGVSLYVAFFLYATIAYCAVRLARFSRSCSSAPALLLLNAFRRSKR